MRLLTAGSLVRVQLGEPERKVCRHGDVAANHYYTEPKTGDMGL